MPISRLFDTHVEAMTAVGELKEAGCRDERIHIVSPEAEGVSAPAIMTLGLSQALATQYAEGVAKGGTLLVVDAPFGTAAAVIEILHRGQPEAVAQVPATEFGTDWRSAAPLSAALGWKVLLDDPTPLSSKFGWSVLSGSQTPKAKLSDNPAPLSSAVGWATLSSKAAPLSEALGWKTLLNDPAPLSAKFGWKTLSNDPAPLSSKLGWKTLSKGRTLY